MMKKSVRFSYSKEVIENGIEVQKSQKSKCEKVKKIACSSNFSFSLIKKVLLGVFFLLIAFLLIYFLFISDSRLIAGQHLEKRDWLGFIGGYLSFAASVLLSIITVNQTRFYEYMDSVRRIETRKMEIRPVFSIKFGDISEDMDAVSIELENVGTFPIRNVCINDEYYCQLLKKDEKYRVDFIAASKKMKTEEIPSQVNPIPFLLSEQDEETGYIKEIRINYDDVDNASFQDVYQLKKFNNTPFYSCIQSESYIEEPKKGEIAQ